MNLKELRAARAAKAAEYDALLKTAEGRELTEVEGDQADRFLAELRSIDTKIDRAHEQEKEALRRALNVPAVQTGAGIQTGSEKDKKDLRNFSVLKMIRSQIDKTPLDGLEKEMHEEAVAEAKVLGQEIRGAGIPSRITSARDNSVTMATQPADGSAIVEKEVRGSMMDMLRNALVTRQLGATYMNDLVGNVAFTRLTERPIASWKPEVGALDKSNVKFAADELSPKRLGTYTIQSLQFLRQTAASVESKIKQEIVYSIAEGVDVAAITGTGADNQPMGILNHAGVAALNIPGLGTNGGVLTRGSLIALRTALLKRNIRGQQLKWLLNAATEGALSDTPIATGSDKFILETEKLLGYPYVMSNMVPSNITKATGANLSAAIFGDWSELYIGQWGGIDLLVDPYTLAVDGQVKIVAQGFFNVLVHRPEAFAYYKDIVTDETV